MIPRVLVVDDDHDVRFLVCSVLSDIGYAVEDANDDESALERVRRGRPHLVVLDFDLPALWRVLAVLGKAQVPVVVMVADATERAQVAEAGASAIVKKPFRCSELLSACQGLLPERAAP
jgi:two-component system response regulator ResD